MIDGLEPSLRMQFGEQFGKVAALESPPDNYNHYLLEEYFPDQGYAKILRTRMGEGLIEYSLLNLENKYVVRRERKYSDRWNTKISEATITYFSDRFQRAHSFKYDDRDNTTRLPQSSRIDYGYHPDFERLVINLAESYYYQGKLNSSFLTFGEAEELADAKIKSIQEYRAHPPMLLHTPSLRKPGVHFGEDKKTHQLMLQDGEPIWGNNLAKVEFGKLHSPKKTQPYQYRVLRDGDQLTYERICRLCNGLWRFSNPAHLDLKEIDEQINGDLSQWTRLYKSIPSLFEMHLGDKDCPNDSKYKEGYDYPPFSGLVI